YKITVFSGSEEKPIEEKILHGKLYFTMPDALQMAGGEVSTNPVDFQPNVVEDRELITGQNPRSDHPIAAKFVEALNRAIAAAGAFAVAVATTLSCFQRVAMPGTGRCVTSVSCPLFDRVAPGAGDHPRRTLLVPVAG